MEDLQPYEDNYSEKKFWSRIKKGGKKIGGQTVYTALLLYYAYKEKETPIWVKRTILGVLGYLVSPIDFIPDITPIVGYTDDAALLAMALSALIGHISNDVQEKAQEKLFSLFGEIDLPGLKES